MRPLYQRLVFLFLGSGILLSAPAQTARIAHFSHGGSLATLAEDATADNFGLPTRVYRNLKIIRLSDTTVLVQGQQQYHGDNHSWQPLKELIQFRTFEKDSVSRGSGYFTTTRSGTRILPLELIKQTYPNAELVGFDKKHKTRRKSSFKIGFPVLQLPPSGLGIMLVLLLAGAGWLLGGEPRLVLKRTV